MTDWLTRWMPAQDIDEALETNRAFVEAVGQARRREKAFRPLYEQLSFILDLNRENAAIEEVVVPPHFSLGADRLKELAVQLRLSTYLAGNVGTLLHGYSDDDTMLQRAEQAVEHLEAQPELRIAAKSVVKVNRLFSWVNTGREQFREYPLVYELLGGTPEPLAARRDPTVDLPAAVRGFFAAETPLVERSSLPGHGLAPEMGKQPEAVLKLLGMAPLTLEVGLDLIPLVDPALGGDLMERIAPLRVTIARETGFVMPSVQVEDNMSLRRNAYQLLVRGAIVTTGELLVGYHLAVEEAETDTSEELVGFPTTEPAYGRRAVWVAGLEADRARDMGYLVLDPETVLLQHLGEAVRRHAHDILSLDEVHAMLEQLTTKMPNAVTSVVPHKLELAEYHLLLKNLLRERVNIRDQATLLEAVAQAVRSPHPDPDTLLELVRLGLSRNLCAELATFDGVLSVLTLDSDAEELLLDYLDGSLGAHDLTLPTPLQQQLNKRLLGTCERSGVNVLVVNTRLRPHLKRLTVRNLPRLTVLSYAEIHPEFYCEVIDAISLVEN